MLEEAGLDAGVLKGSEKDFAGLDAIVAGAKKEGALKAIVYMGEALDRQVTIGDSRIRLRLHPSSIVERNQTIWLGIYADACRGLLTKGD